MQLSSGDRLGPYEIVEPLGAGGMGEVYRARDTRLGRHVAVKISRQQFTERLTQEARAVAALSHPNILAIYDIGTEAGLSYTVTELLEGESLGHALRRGPIEWRRAVELDPNAWEAHDGLVVICLCSTGRLEEALAELEKAFVLEPLSLVIHHHKAWILIRARRFEEAIEVCRKALRIDSAYLLAYHWMAQALQQLARYDEALDAIESTHRVAPDAAPLALASRACVLAASGRAEEARATLAEYQSIPGLGFHDPYLIAQVRAALGEFDRAFDCLEQACLDRSPNLATWLKGDPCMDPIRSDPRFDRMLRRLNLA